jgi:hypothetical protein
MLASPEIYAEVIPFHASWVLFSMFRLFFSLLLSLYVALCVIFS